MIQRQTIKRRRAWGLGLGLLSTIALAAAGWSAWRVRAERTEVTNAEFAAFVQATAYRTAAERPVDRVAAP